MPLHKSRTMCSELAPALGLRPSQPISELDTIIWGQKGQKVNWGTGSVGSWVCGYEETGLRAGGVQMTGEELARLWTHMTLLGLTSKWTASQSRNHGPSLVLSCTSVVAGPLPLAEKSVLYYSKNKLIILFESSYGMETWQILRRIINLNSWLLSSSLSPWL